MKKSILYGTLLLAAAFYLLPLFVMVSTSLKGADEIRTGALLSLPRSFTLDAFHRAWGTACIGVTCEGLARFFWNSLVITLPAVLLSTAVGLMNGYALSFWRFRGSEILFGALLVGCFIPFQIVILPMARFLGAVGLAQSAASVVLVHVIYGIAFTTLFFRNAYAQLPAELLKAAVVDGAGFFTILRRIVLPLSVPVIMVTLIWQFTCIWNDFLLGAVFSGPGSQPITVALNNLANSSTGVKEYNVEMAATLIAALPTLLVYLFAGKYFVRGLTAGAVKG